MDVLITHVYDKERFIHYVRLKFRIRKSKAFKLLNDINKGYYIKLTGIPECDVIYLQRYNIRFSYITVDNGKICSLKIINNMETRNPTITPHYDNERESFNKIIEDSYKKTTAIDISPQPGDEPKQEPLDLFHVKFIKVVYYDKMLNERQIQALLKDKHVKSINIEK